MSDEMWQFLGCFSIIDKIFVDKGGNYREEDDIQEFKESSPIIPNIDKIFEDKSKGRKISIFDDDEELDGPSFDKIFKDK